MTFPAVTFCNLNKFVKSKIDVANEDEKFVKMGLNISRDAAKHVHVKFVAISLAARLCYVLIFGMGQLWFEVVTRQLNKT